MKFKTGNNKILVRAKKWKVFAWCALLSFIATIIMTILIVIYPIIPIGVIYATLIALGISLIMINAYDFTTEDIRLLVVEKMIRNRFIAFAKRVKVKVFYDIEINHELITFKIQIDKTNLTYTFDYLELFMLVNNRSIRFKNVSRISFKNTEKLIEKFHSCAKESKIPTEGLEEKYPPISRLTFDSFVEQYKVFAQ